MNYELCTYNAALHSIIIFTKFVKSSFTLKTEEACIAPRAPTVQGPKLHPDLPRLVWTTGACAAHENSITQRPELHLNASGQQEPLLLPDVATLQGPELQMDLFGQHEPVLLLDVLHHRGLSCTWTCLHYRGLCCTLTCLHHRGPELHMDLFGQHEPVLPYS
jgi:hypothetical protein